MDAQRLRNSRGSVTVETAIVTLLWIGLVTATFEIGRYYTSAMHLKDVSRVAARELASLPLPATATFEEALNDSNVRSDLYDDRELVVDITGMTTAEIEAEIEALPLINRMLAPVMLMEELTTGTAESPTVQTILRFPGTLVEDSDEDSRTGYSVIIPILTAGSQGREILRWAPVLEEERSSADPTEGHFPATSDSRWAGMVGLRINYPYHSAVWGARETCDVEPLPEYCNSSADLGAIRLADDSIVTLPEGGLPAGFTLPTGGDLKIKGTDLRLYGGTRGLGSIRAAGKTQVRPFRRVLSSSAWARREVYSGI